jgi:hypothetical protein
MERNVGRELLGDANDLLSEGLELERDGLLRDQAIRVEDARRRANSRFRT